MSRLQAVIDWRPASRAHVPVGYVKAMAPAPVPGSSTTATPQAAAGAKWCIGALIIALPQIAALAVMFDSEFDIVGRTTFLLTCADVLNFSWIVILRRPALSRRCCRSQWS